MGVGAFGKTLDISSALIPSGSRSLMSPSFLEFLFPVRLRPSSSSVPHRRPRTDALKITLRACTGDHVWKRLMYVREAPVGAPPLPSVGRAISGSRLAGAPGSPRHGSFALLALTSTPVPSLS